MVHDRSGGNRSLTAAAGAFMDPRLGFEPPSSARAATGASKALRPAQLYEVFDADRLFTEALLEFS